VRNYIRSISIWICHIGLPFNPLLDLCFEGHFASGDGKPREAVRVLFSGPLNGDGSKSLAYDSDEISTDDETLPDASDDA
jgi:hypothetical protein